MRVHKVKASGEFWILRVRIFLMRTIHMSSLSLR